MQVDVMVPEEYMGDVIGDLNSRRSQIPGHGAARHCHTEYLCRRSAERDVRLRNYKFPHPSDGQYTMQPSHYALKCRRAFRRRSSTTVTKTTAKICHPICIFSKCSKTICVVTFNSF